MCKKIISFVILFSFLISMSYMFVACDNTCKVSLEKGSVIVLTDVENKDTFTSTIKSNEEKTYNVWLANFYDYNTLKVYANEAQLEITPNNEYNPYIINEESQIVGTITIKNSTADILIKCEVNDKELNLTFALFDSSVTWEKKDILNQLYIDSEKTTTILSLCETNQTLSIFYLTFKEMKGIINVYCNHSLNEYNFQNGFIKNMDFQINQQNELEYFIQTNVFKTTLQSNNIDVIFDVDCIK